MQAALLVCCLLSELFAMTTWLLRSDALPTVRELLPVTALLEEARDLVCEEALAKSIRIVIVGVPDLVLVSREQIVLVIAALLRDAVIAAPPGGRVAVTGQEIERDLAFAVYDTRSREGNLSVFSVPLDRHAN